jgi:phospholipid/cholesterol/gamma-HCH transport system substrate-binding protein
MATKAQKIRLSIFLILSGTVFLIFFFILVGGNFLKRTDPYHIIYHDVSITGLESGASVKLNGVPVGRVIGLFAKSAAEVQVDIEVKHGTPIASDTQAVLNYIGVTGLKYVELTGGTPAAPLLPPDGNINAGQSLMDVVSGQANVIIGKLEMALNNLNTITGPQTNQNLQNVLTSFAGAAAQLDTLFMFNRFDLTYAITQADTVMVQLSAATARLNDAISTANNIMKSGDIQATAKNLRTITDTVQARLDSMKLVELSNQLQSVLVNSNSMVTHYDILAVRGRDDILRALRSMEEAVDNLREITNIIRENPSVLIRGKSSVQDRPE